MQIVNRNPANPRAALRAPVRKGSPRRHDTPRRLSEKQSRNPFIRQALLRLQGMVEYRGDYLRDLDNIHDCGRRTRLEVFRLLASVAEQILLRLDLATGVLGWLNEADSFRLNTQRSIAEDAGISPSALCRLLTLLERAGYALRRFERIQVHDNGLSLVRTRVLIHFTPKFFRHLGLAHQYEMAQKAARKRRDKELARVAAQQQTAQLQRGVQQLQRERKRHAWREAQARRAHQERLQPALTADLAQARLRSQIAVEIKMAHPDMPAAEVNALVDRLVRERLRQTG